MSAVDTDTIVRIRARSNESPDASVAACISDQLNPTVIVADETDSAIVKLDIETLRAWCEATLAALPPREVKEKR